MALAVAASPATLEQDLSREFHLPAEVRLTRNDSEVRVAARGVRPGEYGVIRDVEHRCPKLEFGPLGYAGIFRERSVDVVHARRAHSPNERAHVAVSKIGRLCEGALDR